MINTEQNFSEYANLFGGWCSDRCEETDLASTAGFITQNKLSLVSVMPDSVVKLWSWLENAGVNIVARFYLNLIRGKLKENNVSDLAADINSSLKQGASGAQIFVKPADLHFLVSELYSIRDDLFFNKDLILAFDINDIEPSDWTDIFTELKKIRAGAVSFVSTVDKGEKSDFVGRVYGLLEAWDSGFTGELHFILGKNPIYIRQAYRLVQKIQPELLKKIKFFIAG